MTLGGATLDLRHEPLDIIGEGGNLILRNPLILWGKRTLDLREHPLDIMGSTLDLYSTT